MTLALSDLRLLAWRQFDCDSCDQTAGHRCRTSSGALTIPHVNRMTKATVWDARQPEIDALAAQVTSLKASNDQLDTALAASDDQNAILVQRVTDAQAALAKEQGDKAALEVLFTNLAAEFDTYKKAHPETDPPKPRTLFGMNVSPGTSFTQAATETAATQVKRVTATYGGLAIAKCFYQGALPAAFNLTYEGLIPGKRANVCFKIDPAQLAAGKFDATITSYLDSIPAGWTIYLTEWQEPDDEIWVDKVFTAATYRAALDHLCDLVHAHPAGKDGRAEVWPVFMEYSVSPNPKTPGTGRWQDAVCSPKVDGIFWDAYFNKDKSFKLTSWDMNLDARLDALDAVHTRLGVQARGIAETGDNPHPDNDGAARGAFWGSAYDTWEARGYSLVMYFNAVGTTGDHRVIPGQPFSDPMVALLKSRMTTT